MTNENTATQGVATEKLGSTLRVTMSNPGKKNAIDQAMYLGLAEALTTAAKDPEIRVVWLRGADGDFTSGNMVSDFHNSASGENPPVVAFLEALIKFPKPIVAQVEGVAIGVVVPVLTQCGRWLSAVGV
ncbi:enoyl-CoA hydratase-related protein [Ruegeria lacuscaerulensis]|uniref:enoyl-CoA hydratase-related protein n=1 Tax=Ruegeria lacuscaerulensis TaxID=55218 RepID=UPI00147BA5CE|nr:enoyl-CoA hydratase-related protein [Ruegeria lacuscaerulensis]